MPLILREVQARYPGLVIHQVEASMPGQYQQLADGRLDVGIGRAALAVPPPAGPDPGLMRCSPARCAGPPESGGFSSLTWRPPPGTAVNSPM
jgi:DNA-binding transcriptional LysR family regulator